MDIITLINTTDIGRTYDWQYVRYTNRSHKISSTACDL